MTRKINPEKKAKDKNMNVKMPNKEYNELKNVADKLGLTLSSLIRMLLFSQLDKVRKSGNAKDFFKL